MQMFLLTLPTSTFSVLLFEDFHLFKSTTIVFDFLMMVISRKDHGTSILDVYMLTTLWRLLTISAAILLRAGSAYRELEAQG